MMWDYGYGYGHPIMWGVDAIGAVFSIIWVIVLIVAIVAVIRYLRGGKHAMHWRSSSALELLKERYAKGEIDTAEFHERKKALGE